jgi:hypothetical protein
MSEVSLALIHEIQEQSLCSYDKKCPEQKPKISPDSQMSFGGTKWPLIEDHSKACCLLRRGSPKGPRFPPKGVVIGPNIGEAEVSVPQLDFQKQPYGEPHVTSDQLLGVTAGNPTYSLWLCTPCCCVGHPIGWSFDLSYKGRSRDCALGQVSQAGLFWSNSQHLRAPDVGVMSLLREELDLCYWLHVCGGQTPTYYWPLELGARHSNCKCLFNQSINILSIYMGPRRYIRD